MSAAILAQSFRFELLNPYFQVANIGFHRKQIVVEDLDFSFYATQSGVEVITEPFVQLSQLLLSGTKLPEFCTKLFLSLL
ncbi:MAG TPA: hypothetical protein VKN18_18640 [Blastocatellia bacterium]|nr:hypothetical protein [Blastocatellia bacterium]